MVSRTLCISVLIVSVLLLTTGCTMTGPGTSSTPTTGGTSSDSAIGTWIQTGNTSLIVTLAPEGSALLRFKMPDNGNTTVYSEVNGTWVRNSANSISVKYIAPIARQEKTLIILFEDADSGYIDSVLDASGTAISDPSATKENKLHLARAGSGTGSDSLAVMEISPLYKESAAARV